jgi:hypothetical protein
MIVVGKTHKKIKKSTEFIWLFQNLIEILHN